jgi:hypothetical protein
MQLSTVGFAASNRDPNLAAAALAVGGAVLALWQIVNNFLGRRLWSIRCLLHPLNEQPDFANVSCYQVFDPLNP